jgi:hypothetical protein
MTNNRYACHDSSSIYSGQMDWDNHAIAQYFRTKRYWRSRLYIDEAVEKLKVCQERRVSVSIVTAARSTVATARWRKSTPSALIPSSNFGQEHETCSTWNDSDDDDNFQPASGLCKTMQE